MHWQFSFLRYSLHVSFDAPCLDVSLLPLFHLLSLQYEHRDSQITTLGRQERGQLLCYISRKLQKHRRFILLFPSPISSSTPMCPIDLIYMASHLQK